MGEIEDALARAEERRLEKVKELEGVGERLRKAADAGKTVRLSLDEVWALHALLRRAHGVRDSFKTDNVPDPEGAAAEFILTGAWPAPQAAPAPPALTGDTTSEPT